LRAARANDSPVPDKLILFCGPSGSGKTSIVQHLLNRIPVLSFSVSATTRRKRRHETDGVDYYFLDVETFKGKIRAGEFLEWEEVYENGYYGTLRSEISRITGQGRVPVFDVDVEGGLSIKKEFGAALLDVFVRPPGITELKERLHARATEDEASFRARIAKAEHEITYAARFSHVLVNGDFKEAAAGAEALVREFLGSAARRPMPQP
jgi:guanylate kinase